MFFDRSEIAAGWFDHSANFQGWFDNDLLRPPAGGAGTTITISQGTMTYSGQTVTVIEATTLAITAGVMSYSGQAVNVIRATTLAITQGTMQYIGQLVDVSVGAGSVAAKVFRRLGLYLGLDI